MLINYFKAAWRGILKNKVFAFINIAGLSLGMGCAVLILMWVQNEISYDDYHPDVDNVYRLTTSIKENDWTWESTPLLLADAAKKNIPEIEKVSRLYVGNWPVFTINNNLTYEKKCAYVDEDWFNIFHYEFIKGNAHTFGKNPYSIILTTTAARKYLGNREAIGSTIVVDSMNFQVAGIVKDAPPNSSFQYEAFMPVAALLTDDQRRQNDENWGNFNYITFIKLRPGSHASATGTKLTSIIPGNEKAATAISLTSLKDMHFETGMRSSVFLHGNRTTVYIFSIIAFLLLLVACINYVNLTTAKASMRAKEVSIRKMVGAKPIQLFCQFIAESLLISFIALFTTLFLIQLCLPFYNQVTGKNLVVSFTRPGMWSLIGITLFVSFLLNSIYPAIQLSSFRPMNVFRGFTVLKIKDGAFRKSLVILQFTVSVMLIACTMVIYRQLNFIQRTHPGYNRSQVLLLPLPPGISSDKKDQLMLTMKEALLAQSSILNVTCANQPIINIGSMSTGSADWNGHDSSFNPKVIQLSADGDFQKTMQLQMKEGRWFREGIGNDRNNVVLNEEAVRQFNIQKPVVGQRFTFKGRTGQVIGIVKDFNYQSLHNKTGPLIAFNDPQWYRFLMVRISPGTRAIKDVHNTWEKLVGGHPLEYSFLDDSVNELYKEDQKVSLLIFVFALIAIVISSLGLFGLAAFTAEQRTKEIGIRKVLGATLTNITALLSKDFVKLVCIAICIATPIGFLAMTKWIQNFAYHINMDLWMFFIAGLFALVIALVTTSFQAIKAAIANPVKSLRTE